MLRVSNNTYDSQTSQYKYGDFAFTKLRSVYKKIARHDIEESELQRIEEMWDEEGCSCCMHVEKY